MVRYRDKQGGESRVINISHTQLSCACSVISGSIENWPETDRRSSFSIDLQDFIACRMYSSRHRYHLMYQVNVGEFKLTVFCVTEKSSSRSSHKTYKRWFSAKIGYAGWQLGIYALNLMQVSYLPAAQNSLYIMSGEFHQKSNIV